MANGPSPLERLQAAYAVDGVTSAERAVLVALAFLARPGGRHPGTAWKPSWECTAEQLAGMTCLSVRTVGRALVALRQRGFVETRRLRRQDAGSLSGTLAHCVYTLDLRAMGCKTRRPAPAPAEGSDDWLAAERARRAARGV